MMILSRAWFELRYHLCAIFFSTPLPLPISLSRNLLTAKVMAQFAVWKRKYFLVLIALSCFFWLTMALFRSPDKKLSSFFDRNRFCLLSHSLESDADELWRTLERNVNNCSSISMLDVRQFYNERDQIDHIKASSKVKCTIASYGLSRSLSAESALAEIELDCKLFAIDPDIKKGSAFAKIGTFFQPSIVGRTAEEQKDSVTSVKEEDDYNAKLVRDRVIKKRYDEGYMTGLQEAEENDREYLLETEEEPKKRVKNDKRRELKGNKFRDRNHHEKNVNENSSVAKKNLKKHDRGYTKNHKKHDRDVVNKANDVDSDYDRADSMTNDLVTNLIEDEPKRVLDVSLKTFLGKYVNQPLIYQLLVNVYNGAELLPLVTAESSKNQTICQVNIVFHQKSSRDLHQFSDFFKSMIRNVHFLPLIANINENGFGRLFLVNTFSRSCLELYTYKTEKDQEH